MKAVPRAQGLLGGVLCASMTCIAAPAAAPPQPATAASAGPIAGPNASSRPGSSPSAASRPSAWAEPLPALGVPNLHRIAPQLYRSAQPEARNVAALQKLGIRTVVSFRSFNSDDAVFKGSGIRLVRVPINTWSIGDDNVRRALIAIREAGKAGPVLIHCMHGADRTGVIAAMLRMTEEGWSKADARREMFEGGYGYHTLWRNIPAYLDQVDPAAMRRAVDAAGPLK